MKYLNAQEKNTKWALSAKMYQIYKIKYALQYLEGVSIFETFYNEN